MPGGKWVAGWLVGAFVVGSDAWAGPHKSIDLRQQTDASGHEYSISFCARPSPAPAPAGVPGHAFVAYAKKPKGQNTYQYLAVGLQPESAVSGLLSYSAWYPNPVGYLGEELFTHANEACLVAHVSEADFNQAYLKAKPFANLPVFTDVKYLTRYELTANDCITFMTDVAKGFQSKGLKVPQRQTTELPLTYLRRLVDAN